MEIPIITRKFLIESKAAAQENTESSINKEICGRTKIKNLKITRNISILGACAAPIATAITITDPKSDIFSGIIVMGASAATLAFNSYNAMKSQRDIAVLSKKHK